MQLLKQMKTFVAPPVKGEEREWVEINAEGLVLGRLASRIANILRGKDLPTFTPHADCGRAVIVTNVEKVALTGKKRANKVYYRHTGHPGGIKVRQADKLLDNPKQAHLVLEKAVERMITRCPLGRVQMGNLYLYAGPEHPHAGQKPVIEDFGSKNRKNRKDA